MNFIKKLVAFIKANTNRVLTESEYYFIVFGCETPEDIALIKSVTIEECKYFLDCCWYLDIKYPELHQLKFMRIYRKFESHHIPRLPKDIPERTS